MLGITASNLSLGLPPNLFSASLLHLGCEGLDKLVACRAHSVSCNRLVGDSNKVDIRLGPRMIHPQLGRYCLYCSQFLCFSWDIGLVSGQDPFHPTPALRQRDGVKTDKTLPANLRHQAQSRKPTMRDVVSRCCCKSSASFRSDRPATAVGRATRTFLFLEKHGGLSRTCRSQPSAESLVGIPRTSTLCRPFVDLLGSPGRRLVTRT
jgi:hypothetical protein